MGKLRTEREVWATFNPYDVTPVWVRITATSNVTVGGDVREVEENKPTDNGGVVRKYTTWKNHNQLTFDIEKDDNDATHNAIQDAIDNNTDCIFNVHDGATVSVVADEALGSIDSFVENGTTDAGLVKYSVTFVARNGFNRGATPYVAP